MNLAFLITCYEQKIGTLENIKRIRKYEDLGDSTIIVVCNHPARIFDDVETDAHIYYLPSPPDPSNFQTRSTHNLPFILDNNQQWRHDYLTANILFSIQLGLEKAEELGCTHAAHIHSDTYWETNYVNRLINIANKMTLENKVIYADYNFQLETEQTLPPRFYWHPEGTLYNLEACRKHNDFGFNFTEIYESRNTADEHNYPNDFWSSRWECIECLIPQWLLWTNFGIITNNYYDTIPKEFYDLVEFGIPRLPHGRFEHGLVNMPGMQVRKTVEKPQPEKIVEPIVINEQTEPATISPPQQSKFAKTLKEWKTIWKKLRS